MRDLNEYLAREWLTAVPAVIAFKEARDAFLRELYCARRAPGLDRFLADNAHLRGKDFAVTIAFEKAWLIRHFLERLARFAPGLPVIVADNSRNAASAGEIEAAVREGGGAYFKLPANPIRNINRSHGNALNWTWRHIIRPLAPRTFAFLDHDIFPMAPVDMEALLGDQDFYGHRMDGRAGWAIWAGYSFYRFDALAGLTLDFNPDMDRNLVAGGRNYGPLFRRYDVDKLRFADRKWVNEIDPVTGERLFTERIDGWVHFGGVSYQGNKMRARAYLEGLIGA